MSNSDSTPLAAVDALVVVHCRLCGNPCSADLGKLVCGDCQGDVARTRQTKWRAALRKQVFDHYGQRCVCCGEDNPAFLSLDHVNGDGAKHRRSLGGGERGVGPYTVYKWVVNNGFPDGFQVLCMNCNWGRARNGGVCPHQER